MRTIGEFLKKARESKNLSLATLERKTRIKSEFIEAIEGENWERLPEFPVVLGFVKNLSSALGLGEKEASALFKRDYPPQKILSFPSQIKKQFSWTPRLTFFLSAGTVLILLGTYLGASFISFNKPPKIEVASPKQEEILPSGAIRVVGRVDPEATLMVNNQQILVDETGNFDSEIDVSADTGEIVFVATSRSGKTSTLSRSIVVLE